MKEMFTIFKICLRERLLANITPLRVNEPTMAMSLEEQIKGFENASSYSGPLAPVQCFAAWNTSRVITNSKKILELGCGTGHVVTKMAYMNPDKHFIALDLSEGMIKEAKKLADSMELKNIEFHIGDMTNLSKYRNLGVDAITSSLAFHHLRSEEDLTQVFREIKSVIGNKGVFSVYDLGRLKSKQSILDFISIHNDHTPVYVEDTINSFQAGFTKDDFKQSLLESGLLYKSTLKSTLVIPAFIKAHSKLYSLRQNQKEKFSELFQKLSFKNKFLFYALRVYFLT